MRLSDRKKWLQRFQETVKPFHPRSVEKVARKLLTRCDSVKSGMTTRSKKKNVECTVTLTDIREMMLENYGKPCKYCGRLLTIKNMVIDHIVPMSKGGPSTRKNLQPICRVSNNMKGSLEEKDFLVLLEWLNSVSPELKKDISIRLAKGIH